jgi:hypothetical protein
MPKMTMRTALVFLAGAMMSIASADATQRANVASANTGNDTRAWVVRGYGPWHQTARTGDYKSYEDCRDTAVKQGWRPSENFWFCSTPQPTNFYNRK